MKNEIILWLSSLIIVFLIGYIKNVTNKDYPITGTFGIEGKKVSYKLDKVSFDKNFYKNIIISDLKGINAKLVWKKDHQKYETDYTENDKALVCEIPKLKPGERILYKIIIYHNEKTYEIPKDNFVSLTFWGHIPKAVNFLYFFFIYSSLLISMRSVLELFAQNKNLKKYAFITCIFFITLVSIINPLYITYKLEAINHFVPPFNELLNPLLLTILIFWIIGTILIFNKNYIRIVTIIISTATTIIFFLL